MKCISVLSVAEHGIIPTLMFWIDFFFFQMGFYHSTADLPESNSTLEWCRTPLEKLNLQGAMTSQSHRAVPRLEASF